MTISDLASAIGFPILVLALLTTANVIDLSMSLTVYRSFSTFKSTTNLESYSLESRKLCCCKSFPMVRNYRSSCYNRGRKDFQVGNSSFSDINFEKPSLLYSGKRCRILLLNAPA